MSVRRLSPDQPASFAFSAETLKKAEELDRQVPARQAAVGGDPAAVAGAEAGRLGLRAAIRAVAEMLGMPVIRVLEVATFYTMFMLEPVGTLPGAGLRHDALQAARRGAT